MSDIPSAFNTKLKLSGTIFVQLHAKEAHTRVEFGVAKHLIVTAILRTTCIDKCIKFIHAAELKISSSYSSLVRIFMIHRAKNEAEMKRSGTCHDITKDLKLTVIPTRNDPMYITATRRGSS